MSSEQPFAAAPACVPADVGLRMGLMKNEAWLPPPIKVGHYRARDFHRASTLQVALRTRSQALVHLVNRDFGALAAMQIPEVSEDYLKELKRIHEVRTMAEEVERLKATLTGKARLLAGLDDSDDEDEQANNEKKKARSFPYWNCLNKYKEKFRTRHDDLQEHARLRLMFYGPPQAGKSALVNAILTGRIEDEAPTSEIFIPVGVELSTRCILRVESTPDAAAALVVEDTVVQNWPVDVAQKDDYITKCRRAVTYGLVDNINEGLLAYKHRRDGAIAAYKAAVEEERRAAEEAVRAAEEAARQAAEAAAEAALRAELGEEAATQEEEEEEEEEDEEAPYPESDESESEEELTKKVKPPTPPPPPPTAEELAQRIPPNEVPVVTLKLPRTLVDTFGYDYCFVEIPSYATGDEQDAFAARVQAPTNVACMVAPVHEADRALWFAGIPAWSRCDSGAFWVFSQYDRAVDLSDKDSDGREVADACVHAATEQARRHDRIERIYRHASQMAFLKPQFFRHAAEMYVPKPPVEAEGADDDDDDDDAMATTASLPCVPHAEGLRWIADIRECAQRHFLSGLRQQVLLNFWARTITSSLAETLQEFRLMIEAEEAEVKRQEEAAAAEAAAEQAAIEAEIARIAEEEEEARLEEERLRLEREAEIEATMAALLAEGDDAEPSPPGDDEAVPEAAEDHGEVGNNAVAEEAGVLEEGARHAGADADGAAVEATLADAVDEAQPPTEPLPPPTDIIGFISMFQARSGGIAQQLREDVARDIATIRTSYLDRLVFESGNEVGPHVTETEQLERQHAFYMKLLTCLIPYLEGEMRRCFTVNVEAARQKAMDLAKDLLDFLGLVLPRQAVQAIEDLALAPQRQTSFALGLPEVHAIGDGQPLSNGAVDMTRPLASSLQAAGAMTASAQATAAVQAAALELAGQLPAGVDPDAEQQEAQPSGELMATAEQTATELDSRLSIMLGLAAEVELPYCTLETLGYSAYVPNTVQPYWRYEDVQDDLAERMRRAVHWDVTREAFSLRACEQLFGALAHFEFAFCRLALLQSRPALSMEDLLKIFPDLKLIDALYETLPSSCHHIQMYTDAEDLYKDVRRDPRAWTDLVFCDEGVLHSVDNIWVDIARRTAIYVQPNTLTDSIPGDVFARLLYLRIEALSRTGDFEEGARTASLFLESYPELTVAQILHLTLTILRDHYAGKMQEGRFKATVASSLGLLSEQAEAADSDATAREIPMLLEVRFLGVAASWLGAQVRAECLGGMRKVLHKWVQSHFKDRPVPSRIKQAWSKRERQRQEAEGEDPNALRNFNRALQAWSKGDHFNVPLQDEENDDEHEKLTDIHDGAKRNFESDCTVFAEKLLQCIYWALAELPPSNIEMPHVGKNIAESLLGDLARTCLDEPSLPLVTELLDQALSEALDGAPPTDDVEESTEACVRRAPDIHEDWKPILKKLVLSGILQGA
eukprot:TRINITY_DN30_c6_g1_i1.p1 TRINITY_DN30_c6_g1~~TRINITY_DN30_c6_g1_i1.p1  ORF type:complete len:1459 (-),score=393.69 TRINITY_DN30_c6_g1_i1:126-4502(-)